MEIEKTKNSLVVQSNKLIESSYSLTINEQKLIRLLISKIQPEDEELKRYEIKISDLMELFNIKNANMYIEIPKITKKLKSKVLEIQIDKDTLIQPSWLGSVKYYKGTLHLGLDADLRPFLLQLKEKFTQYELRNVLNFKSSYSIRIYEILKQYEKIGERTLDLVKLKELIKVEDKYKLYADFKRYVLNASQKEINDKTDISFEFEEIKNGRRVDKIKFIIKSNKGCTIEKIKRDKEQNEIDIQTKIKIDTLKALIEYEISEKEILSILNIANGDLVKVIEKYYIIRSKKDITNFVGIMIDSIKNDYKDMQIQNKDNKTNTKTKFHNFEQRFEKYSPEEFERIALENQKKKFGT